MSVRQWSFAAAAVSASLDGTAGWRSQPTRERAQTLSDIVGWSAMSIGDNAISCDIGPHIDGYLQYMQMLYVNVMIFSVIIYVIKMQIKHVIISNLIIGCYYWGNVHCCASTCVMVRYNCVKMRLKSNLSWFVHCTTSVNGRQRAQCECNGALRAFD